MKKIILLFILVSSVIFGIGEEKFGMHPLKTHGVNGEIAVNKINDNGLIGFVATKKESIQGAKELYEGLVENLMEEEINEEDIEVLEVKNEEFYSKIILRPGEGLVFIERDKGDIKILILDSKDHGDLNKDILNYAKLNGVITDSQSEKILEYINK